MPIILLGRVPLPRLTTYVAISVLLFVCSCYYSSLDVIEVIKPIASEQDVHETSDTTGYDNHVSNEDTTPLQSQTRDPPVEEGVFDDIKVITYLVSIVFCVIS